MDEEALSQYITQTFQNVETADNMGYRFFFYGDDHRLPFATIAFTDNEYEKVSQLNRPGVFRLNIGVSRQTFQSLFGTEQLDIETLDFTELNRIMPHPDYWKQFFICVLNPGTEDIADLKSMLAEAYGIAKERYEKRSGG